MKNTHKILFGAALLALVSLSAVFAFSNNGTVVKGTVVKPVDAVSAGVSCPLCAAAAPANCCCGEECKCCEGCKDGNCTCGDDCACCGCCEKSADTGSCCASGNCPAAAPANCCCGEECKCCEGCKDGNCTCGDDCACCGCCEK